MDINQHWLHSTRRQLIKATGHLLDMRRALLLANDHAKLIGNFNADCRAIESNIDALQIGVQQTIKFAGIAVANLDAKIEDKHAVVAPIYGGNKQTKLTPLQRALQREGTEFPSSIPTHETKTERRLPKLLNFTLKQPKKQHNRKVNRAAGHIPL